jgi:hypothetical protein
MELRYAIWLELASNLSITIGLWLYDQPCDVAAWKLERVDAGSGIV